MGLKHTISPTHDRVVTHTTSDDRGIDAAAAEAAVVVVAVVAAVAVVVVVLVPEAPAVVAFSVAATAAVPSAVGAVEAVSGVDAVVLVASVSPNESIATCSQALLGGVVANIVQSWRLPQPSAVLPFSVIVLAWHERLQFGH